jgi:hypothetical protein
VLVPDHLDVALQADDFLSAVVVGEWPADGVDAVDRGCDEREND